MCNASEQERTLRSVPLFPLPNVVLFPRAILPLHIFEERYKAMTADVLAGDGRIAMALLRPGWEKCYYGRPPIEPVVCLGRIVSHEQLSDGNYNFLLEGTARAHVESETGTDPHDPNRALYRTANLRLFPEATLMEIDLGDERDRLSRLFASGPLGQLPLGRQFRKMLTSPMPTADIADLIAFNLLEDVPLKQSLLAEGDVRRRIERLAGALDDLVPLVAAQVSAGVYSSGDPNLN